MRLIKIAILISFIFLMIPTIVQLNGYTLPERLALQKKETNIIDKKPPVITLTQPLIKNGDTLTVTSNTITIYGKVTGESDSISLFINGVTVSLSKENKFSNTTFLSIGLNSINITALDKYKKFSSYIFTIIYEPPKVKPLITIIDPQINDGNELSVEKKMLTIRGKVITEYGIKDILVNNKNAALLNNGEFYSNCELSYGKNNISIRAIDNFGNESNKNIIIDWTPDMTGPLIKIIDPPVTRGIKVVSKTDVVLLKGQAIDESGILDVTVNSRKTTLQTTGEFNISLYLQAGDNPIIVEATDKKYNVTVDTFVVTRKLESLITAGRYIALIIGINSYQGYWLPLANAVNDAEGIAKELKNNYMIDTVITILDKQATRNNIIHELEKLTKTVKTDDNLLIYYSGHGQFKKELNKGYWVPVDAKSNSIADFISNNEVKTFLGGIPAKHTLLISDACFAGDIFRGMPTESIEFDPNNMERYYREVYNKTSRIAITSGGLEEVGDAGKDGHSVFTYYLLKSMKDNKSRYLDATQLFNDFRIAVTNNSEQTPLLQVVRDTGDEGGQFIFVKLPENKQIVYVQDAYLNISIDPSGANLFIDNVKINEREYIKLHEGEHKIRITKDNYYDLDEKLSLIAGENTKKEFTLIPKVGELQVELYPIEASAYLKNDDKVIEVWKGNKKIINLLPGVYKIETKLNGYGDVNQTVNITSGQTQTINIVMHKIKGYDISEINKLSDFIISASYSADTSKMVIFYGLDGNSGDNFEVTLDLLRKNDKSFNYKPKYLSGDVGIGQFAGDNRKIIWNLDKEFPGGLIGNDYILNINAVNLSSEEVSISSSIFLLSSLAGIILLLLTLAGK